MAIDAPAAGVIAEVLTTRCTSGSCRRHGPPPDSGVPEADDVGASIAGHVGQEARVAVDAPAAGVIAEVVTTRCGASNCHRPERHRDAAIAEADDVGASIAGQVASKRGWRSTRQPPAS